MKEITLTNYESVEKFIEAVENAERWDAIPKEDYEEAFDQVAVESYKFDDPDELWENFLLHYKAFNRANEILEELKEEESDGYSHSREFFSSLVGEISGKYFSNLWMNGKIDTLINELIFAYPYIC